MKAIEDILRNQNLIIKGLADDGGTGFVKLPGERCMALVIFSIGCGWDHVSASYKSRCLSWDEMCFLKEMFFEDEECVVQFHPPKSQYVNDHPFCLHLWRPQDNHIALPPKELV